MLQLKSGPGGPGGGRPRRRRQPQGGGGGGRIFCGSLFCRPHFVRNRSLRSSAQRATRSATPGEALPAWSPAFPPEPSPVTLKAPLASATSHAGNSSVCSMCAQPIPSHALLADQQTKQACRRRLVAQRSAETPSFPLVALMPHACCCAMQARLEKFIGSQNTYPPHCRQLP